MLIAARINNSLSCFLHLFSDSMVRKACWSKGSVLNRWLQ